MDIYIVSSFKKSSIWKVLFENKFVFIPSYCICLSEFEYWKWSVLQMSRFHKLGFFILRNLVVEIEGRISVNTSEFQAQWTGLHVYLSWDYFHFDYPAELSEPLHISPSPLYTYTNMNMHQYLYVLYYILMIACVINIDATKNRTCYFPSFMVEIDWELGHVPYSHGHPRPFTPRGWGGADLPTRTLEV